MKSARFFAAFLKGRGFSVRFIFSYKTEDTEMYEIGLSSKGFDLNRENFEKLAKSGISAIEISMKPEKYSGINYAETAAMSKEYGVKLWSYHLPFSPFESVDMSSADRALRENTVAYYSELIKKGSDIGIDKFVVHPSSEPISDEQRSERKKCSMESLDLLSEIAYRNGARIAVEDLPRTCLGNTIDELSELISANDKLGVCFDTNHMLIDNNLDFMKKLGDKIITVHVSDYDFVNERHWLPGEGKLDWQAMLAGLRQTGYTGVWLYEIELKCPRTIMRDRDLTFEDFYTNASCIFAGEKPPVLGRYKENLGMWE